jgi:hypothetical protein
VLDAALVEAIASELGTHTGLIEKDWQVVRALSVLAGLDHGIAKPTFSGGTSLSKGWGLISRFSEDIDFKVAMPASATKENRSTYRKMVLAALQEAGFSLCEPAEDHPNPLVGNGSRFFRADFNYPSIFPLPTDKGLRPHLRVEMSFDAPALAPVQRPLQSFVAQAQQQAPEVVAFPCVSPVETAADKLSALAWRACTRDRSSKDDDPTIIRHLHDLAALEDQVATAEDFIPLLRQKVEADSSRGGGRAPADPVARFAGMLELLRTDPLWAKEYDEFVRQVSFASPDQEITFDHAFDATSRLVARFIEAARR